MRVLGVDPSLTNFGYVVLEDSKILEKGRFQTSPEDGLNVQRYVLQANRLAELARKYDIKYLATESPIFDMFSTEILYGLQSFLHCAYWSLGLKVLNLTPPQIKSYACPHMSANKVLKSDMVKAARAELGMRENERLSNDVADAYFVSRIGLRWWQFYEKELPEKELTEKEKHMFTGQHTFTRGKKKGQTEKKGFIFRKNELYYLYDELVKPDITFNIP